MGLSPLESLLRGQSSDKIPIWFMRQAGRYLPEYRQIRSKFNSFREFLFSQEDITEVTLQPMRRFDLDAAIIFSDILVVPILLGLDVDVLEGYGPKLSPLKSPDDLKLLVLEPDFRRCTPIYEAISNVRSGLALNRSLIGFAGGPWTLASYMIEGTTSKTFGLTKKFAYMWPEAFLSLLNIIADVTAQHLINQIRSGANVIKIFDSWAGHVPYHCFNDWVFGPHARIVHQVREAYPDIPIISFLKGAEIYYESYLSQISVNAVAIGSAAYQPQLVQNLSKEVILQGAIDPYLLVTGGNLLVQEIKRQHEALGKGRYIFNLGHGIVPETPIENVQLAIETVRSLHL